MRGENKVASLKNILRKSRYTKFVFILREKGKKIKTSEVIIQKSKSRAIDELKKTMAYLPNHVFRVLSQYEKVECQTEENTQLEITLHEVVPKMPRIWFRKLSSTEIGPVIEFTKDWSIFQWTIFFFRKSKFFIS